MDRDKVFKENENLVHFVIHKYFKHFKNKEDLVQEGYLGLLKAIDTFNPDKNIQFSTYATKCIINEIYGYNMKNQPIKIPNIRKHKDVIINILPLDLKYGSADSEEKDLTLQDRLEGKNNIEEFIYSDFVNNTIDNYIDKIQNEKHRELFREFIELMKETGKRDTEYLARKYNLSKCSVTVIIADNLYKLRKELDHE